MAVRASREELYTKFKEAAALPVDDQAKVFLRAFAVDFQGAFEEVLDVANEWKKYGGGGMVDEFQAHLFLEKRGETLTVAALREKLKVEVDIEKNRQVAFIEYALWKWGKKLVDMFFPDVPVDPAALAALEKAIDDYQKVLAVRAARDQKMAELEATAALGGVKGMAAKAQLEQMKSEDLLEQNRREVTSAANKRKAQRVVDDVETRRKEEERKREETLKLEQARLAEEKKRKEEEEARAKEESRRRLKEKASLWGN